MKSQRTTEQWHALLASRKTFNGTNIEFCAKHKISITSFYKHQANLRVQSASSFVQVKTTTEQVQVQSYQEIQFDVRSGKLTLPADLPTNQMVAIIRGLSS